MYLQITLHLSSKHFRSLLKTLKLSDVCFKQQLLRPLLTFADEIMLDREEVARKEHLGKTRKLKKLFLRKTRPVRLGLHVSHQLSFVRIALKHVRLQPQKLDCLRKRLRRN